MMPAMTTSVAPAAGARLRAPPAAVPFHIVLVEPEIPPNTGNIARLCAATQSAMHLVGKLGFRIDEHAVRRAGLDYWHLVSVCTHDSFAAAERYISPAGASPREPAINGALVPVGSGRSWFFTGKTSRNLYTDVQFLPGDSLVFGKESVGLSEELIAAHPDNLVAIPTLGAVRSLNLANAVAISLYEALRQVGGLGGATLV